MPDDRTTPSAPCTRCWSSIRTWIALAVTGERTEAEQILCGLLDPRMTSQPPGVLAYHIAMACAGLGDMDAALRWLDRGYDERASFMIGVKIEPGSARLHGDPRWSPLLCRIGLAP